MATTIAGSLVSRRHLGAVKLFVPHYVIGSRVSYKRVVSLGVQAAQEWTAANRGLVSWQGIILWLTLALAGAYAAGFGADSLAIQYGLKTHASFISMCAVILFIVCDLGLIMALLARKMDAMFIVTGKILERYGCMDARDLFTVIVEGELFLVYHEEIPSEALRNV